MEYLTMHLLAAVVETTGSANVWDFGMQFAAVIGTFGTGYFAFKANGSARSAKQQTEELRASTTTNGTTGGHSGVSLNQVHAKLDDLGRAVERVDVLLGDEHKLLTRVVRDVKETRERVAKLERPPVDFNALGAELDS